MPRDTEIMAQRRDNSIHGASAAGHSELRAAKRNADEERRREKARRGRVLTKEAEEAHKSVEYLISKGLI